MNSTETTRRDRLILPFMAPFYNRFAQPVGWLVFRLIIGGLLMVEGWPKIIDPLGQVGFVEHIVGIHPGWLFAPLLAVVQFVGGLMIAVGLLTRPVALANALILAFTVVFHRQHPFGSAFLSPDGLAFLKTHADYLTAAGQYRLLGDGGHKFLALAQNKAENNSTFWAAGAALIAAYGGGKYSIDRLLPKEF